MNDKFAVAICEVGLSEWNEIRIVHAQNKVDAILEAMNYLAENLYDMKVEKQTVETLQAHFKKMNYIISNPVKINVGDILWY